MPGGSGPIPGPAAQAGIPRSRLGDALGIRVGTAHTAAAAVPCLVRGNPVKFDNKKTLNDIRLPSNGKELLTRRDDGAMVGFRSDQQGVVEVQGTKSLPMGEEGSEKGSVLARSLKVLDALMQSPVALNLTDVARVAGLNVNTAKRILAELAEAGYVAKASDSRRFLPGPKALFPLPLYHPMNVFCRETFEVARQLRDSLGETISLIIFLGSERVVASLAPGRESLHPMYDTWLTTPLHGSPSGKILLASLDEDERDRLLGPGPYRAWAPRTITDPAELARELDRVRENGVALSVDETIGGITAVGAPIMSDGGVLGCLVAVGSTYRMATGSRLKTIEAELKQAATMVSTAAPSVRAIPYLTGVMPSALRQISYMYKEDQTDE